MTCRQLAIGEVEDALPVASIENVLFVAAILHEVAAVDVGEGFVAVHDPLPTSPRPSRNL